MENEAQMRAETLARMEMQVLRLRRTVEATHRRIVDLKQGAAAARAIRSEQAMQSRLRTTDGAPAAIDEAEALIAQVMEREDPGERADILQDIDASLDRRDVADRMADAGLGTSTRSTAAQVLARLKAPMASVD